MTPQTMALRTAPLLAAAALLVAACGSPSAGPGRQMTFPTSSPSPTATTGSATATATPPVARPIPRVPPAREPVTGRGLVLQRSDGQPQLCLGPVTATFPPGCEGVPLLGWDWATAGPHDEDDVGGGVTRYGSYAVTGRFDGRTLTVTGSVPLQPDDVDPEPSPRPSAPPHLDAAQWDGVFRALAVAPGQITLGPAGDTGPMLLTVIYDDGTIQAWADASFGAGTVLVTSALR
jgi:hypothetical protein